MELDNIGKIIVSVVGGILAIFITAMLMISLLPVVAPKIFETTNASTTSLYDVFVDIWGEMLNPLIGPDSTTVAPFIAIASLIVLGVMFTFGIVDKLRDYFDL